MTALSSFLFSLDRRCRVAALRAFAWPAAARCFSGAKPRETAWARVRMQVIPDGGVAATAGISFRQADSTRRK